MKKRFAAAALAVLIASIGEVAADPTMTPADECVNDLLQKRAKDLLGENFDMLVFPRSHVSHVKADCIREIKANTCRLSKDPDCLKTAPDAPFNVYKGDADITIYQMKPQ